MKAHRLSIIDPRGLARLSLFVVLLALALSWLPITPAAAQGPTPTVPARVGSPAGPMPAGPKATAPDLANAFAEVPAQVTGASFVHQANAASTAVFSSHSTFFPSGSDASFIGMSSGIAANMPTVGADTNTDFGDSFRCVFDVTILRIDLLAPAGTDCLQFDTQFFSQEYPEYIGTQYNDAFVAELDVNDWLVTGGTTINAPHNFALAPGNKILSVNSGLTWSPALAAGTAFVSPHGGTGKYTVSKPTTAGAHSLYLSIWDMSDHVLDTAVYLDRLKMFNSSGTCSSGVIVTPSQTPVAPSEVPEADTLLLMGGGLGGVVTWLGWQRRKLTRKNK